MDAAFRNKKRKKKSVGSFVGSFLLPYMRISRWGEIGKKDDCGGSSLLSDRGCLGWTCYAVCHEEAWYLLTRRENDARASMLSPVTPRTMCLPSLCADWRCFSLTPAARFHSSAKAACITTPLKHTRQGFTWIGPEAPKGGLDQASFTQVMNCPGGDGL